MRKYAQDKTLKQVICNQCGRNLLVEDGMPKEDFFEGKKIFGYFSNKDGIVQQFDLCESCYEKITAGFRIPAEESEQLELL